MAENRMLTYQLQINELKEIRQKEIHISMLKVHQVEAEEISLGVGINKMRNNNFYRNFSHSNCS